MKQLPLLGPFNPDESPSELHEFMYMLMDNQLYIITSIRALMAAHLVDLMEDAKLYGWEAVRAFHTIWIQQMEQGCVSWTDQDIKMTCRHSIVCHRPMVVHQN